MYLNVLYSYPTGIESVVLRFCLIPIESNCGCIDACCYQSCPPILHKRMHNNKPHEVKEISFIAALILVLFIVLFPWYFRL